MLMVPGFTNESQFSNIIGCEHTRATSSSGVDHPSGRSLRSSGFFFDDRAIC